MIPKVIHYCWFGGKPLPQLAVKCIESWKKYLPDYEIKEWNESNFDVNAIPYTREAYSVKKYAFVSDYARFWILYHYGGLYFDTDVEVIRNMDAIVEKGPFMGCERYVSDTIGASVAPGLGLGVNPGLGLGVNPGLGLYKEILDMYERESYIMPDGTYSPKTVVHLTTEILCQHGLKATNEIQQCAGVWIYPKDYFCPKDIDTRELVITSNSVSIHHYDGSWLPKSKKFNLLIQQFLGRKITLFIVRVKAFFRKKKNNQRQVIEEQIL